MDTIEVIGDEIYYLHWRLGAKPADMPATQWDCAVETMCQEYREASPDELSEEYARGKQEALDDADEDQWRLTRLKDQLRKRLP